MNKEYITHENITKELLDSIKVGDLIKVNDWNTALRVKAVSENYFVMARKMFGKYDYSVCEKIPWGGIRYNRMRGGLFHVGMDSWIFGAPIWCDFNNDGGQYDFEDAIATQAYIETFELKDGEDGKSSISPRSAVPIYIIQIKSA